MDFSFTPEQARSATRSSRSARRSTPTTGCARTARAASRRTSSTARWPTPAGSASHARGVRRRRPRHHRGGDHDADDRRSPAPACRARRRPHEHLRPAPGGGVRHRGAEAAHAAAADRRAGQGLLRRHRAERRPEHAEAEDARGARGRPLRRQRPEGLDLDRPGRRQDAAAGAHHAARGGAKPTEGLSPVLHRPRPQRVEVREIEKMGRKAVDSNQVFFDGLRGAGRGPHRRGRQGLRVHPARHEPRAHPDRRRSGRARPAALRARGRYAKRARRVRPADRPEPGDPASAGAVLDGARGGQPDGA